MKTVGMVAIMHKVNVVGVVMMDGVVENNGLEMDVMGPLVVQINICVY